MTRKKKMKWQEDLDRTSCENCREPTHFRGSLAPSTDQLRRKRLGLCAECYEKLKNSDQWVKICEKRGWSLNTGEL